MSNESAREYAEGIAESLRNESVDDVGEYLESILDYQYTRDSRGELVSVRLLVAFGGPNAWVTFDGSGALIEVNWYSEVQRLYVERVELSALVMDYFVDAGLVGYRA